MSYKLQGFEEFADVDADVCVVLVDSELLADCTADVAAPMFAIGIAGNRPWAISKDISMAATYAWPCILSGLIVDHFGNDGLPFYVLAGFAMVVIIFVNHNDLM